jgi:hypothetical protein
MGIAPGKKEINLAQGHTHTHPAIPILSNIAKPIGSAKRK